MGPLQLKMITLSKAIKIITVTPNYMGEKVAHYGVSHAPYLTSLLSRDS